MKTERQLYKEKVEVLASLAAWSHHVIEALSSENDLEAAESLDRLIKAMENPKVIENLKEVRDWLTIPF